MNEDFSIYDSSWNSKTTDEKVEELSRWVKGLVQKDPLEPGTADLRGVDVTPQSIARLKRGLSIGDWEDK